MTETPGGGGQSRSGQRVRLKDIARLASVDVSTVSRVLNNDRSRGVSDEVRKKILRIAKENSYHPNVAGRSLRTSKSNALALIIPDLGNPGIAQTYRGIQEVASPNGWAIVVIEDSRMVSDSKDWMSLVRERRVDGVLMLSASINDPAALALREEGYPLVLVNRRVQGFVGSVTMDDGAAAAAAVDHLFSLGHRRIAHIAGPATTDTGIRRSRGFSDRAAELGLLPNDLTIAFQSDYTIDAGYAAFRELAVNVAGMFPTAIFVAGFLGALGVLKAATEDGLRVPEDLSIVASDDIELASSTSPPLTMVRLPNREMGRMAAEMLIGAVNGGTLSDLVATSRPELIARKSTAEPRIAFVDRPSGTCTG